MQSEKVEEDDNREKCYWCGGIPDRRCLGCCRAFCEDECPAGKCITCIRNNT